MMYTNGVKIYQCKAKDCEINAIHRVWEIFQTFLQLITRKNPD